MQHNITITTSIYGTGTFVVTGRSLLRGHFHKDIIIAIAIVITVAGNYGDSESK